MESKNEKEAIKTDCFFEEFFKNSPYSIAILDEDGNLIRINEAGRNLLHISKEDVIFKYNIFKDNIIKAQSKMLFVKSVFEKCESVKFLLEYDTAKLETIYFENTVEVILEITLVPILSKNGKLISVVMQHNDITESKSHEEHLKNAFNKLKDLTEELEKSNKELDDFAYIASHDLREPLRGINNYSKFLIEDYSEKLDNDGKDMLLTISRLTVRLEQFIDSLLFYSRLGRTSIIRESISMNEIIDDVMDSFGFSIREKHTSINILKNQPIIYCDRLRTTAIYKNLIGNALKYNDKPKRCVSIGYFYRNQKSKNPVLYVKDNGIGIDEKHIDKVFTIFKRLHSRDRFGGGIGAGLTIAKKCVELQHGNIWIESKLGEGTTFYFTLASEKDINI